MQKITPHFWYDTQAEEAAKLYTSIFKNSKILSVARYPKSAEAVSGQKAGTVMTVEFELEGQRFLALNGGPMFKFNESVSFMVNCKDQKEIDFYWEKLTADGGQESQCGWLKDKFGLSWQIVPEELGKIMSSNPAKSEKVMAELLKMKKLDINKLKEAAK
ncbi:VOC family protein [Candidatus Parcubacteria bacterium]|nr:VOC family protein [Candidatus Parcubacteria bacterium]